MTGPKFKVGDRVHVEFDGYVDEGTLANENGSVDIQVDGTFDGDGLLVALYVPGEVVQLVARPVKAGDVLDSVDQIEALPEGTVIVTANDPAPAVNVAKGDGRFHMAGSSANYHAWSISRPVRVVHVDGDT